MALGEPKLTVPALLTAAARERADTEAVVDGAVRWTYRELAERVRAFSAACLASGVRPGDRVALWAANGHRWIVAALGVISAGGVLVPVNTRYKGAEALWILRRSDARLVLVEDGFLDNDYVAMLREAAEDGAATLPEIVAINDEHDRVCSWDGFLARAADVGDEEVRARAEAVREDDYSDMLFTSGTTGNPKGALTTHAQNLRVFGAWSARTGLRHGDRYLVVNPMFHTFGYKAGVLACLITGATILPQAVFDVTRTLRLVDAERVSVLPGPPTLYSSILDHPQRGEVDLSSLRLAVTGAASVPIALVERVRTELFPTVLTAYGLTESCGVVTTCVVGDDARVIAETSGRAIDGVEVAVVGEDGAALPAGETGEIVVRGYNVMQGYHEDPAATAEAIDADGWLHTGDVGRLDAEGNLTITDRLKDMFVVGGFNAYPAEIEQVLARHAAVAEAAVVGIPHERLGEVGRAHVVVRPDADPTEEDVLAHCRRNLANFKVPREVVFVDALPRNASGKVLKTVLRAGADSS